MKAAISSMFRALLLVVVGMVATSAYAQSVTLAPATQGFPATVVGATTNPVTMTLINTGAAPLTIGNITIGPDFTQTTTCGASLAPAARCTFSVRFAPLSVGAHPETLAVTDSAAGSPHVINLAGTGLRQASLSVASLAFGSQAAGTAGASKPVTVTNTQAVAMTITGITVGADYQQTNTCGTSLPALGTCTVNVSFKPTATGSRPGTLSVSGNIVNNPLTATLTGTGTAGVGVSPSNLDFGGQAVATTSLAKLVTITNGQTTAVTISGVASSGDFARTTTCGASLAAASSCSFSVTFTPAAAGSRTGALSFVLGSNPVNVSLTGTGTAAGTITVSPASLTFSTQRVGSMSSPQVITIGNSTGAAASITTSTINGDFARTTTCATSVAANSSCTFSVTFSPASVGNQTGSLAFSLNGVSKNVPLTGTGAVALTMSPAALTFNAQLLNTVSVAQVVTVTNALSDPVTMGATTISGDYQQTNNCTTLAGGASCTVNVTFKPIAAGTRAGVLTLNPGGTAQTLSLTGTGSSTAVALNPTTLAFGNQAVSTASLVKTLTLTNSQTSAVAITSIATNLADYAQTNTCGSSLAGSSSCVISVTLTPAAAGARTGTLTVKAGASTLNVSLTGTGVAAVVVSPLSQGFPAQAVGTNGTPFNVTVKNNLNVPLGITGITLVGDFTNTTTCASSLLPGSSCVVTVTFHPTATGARTATLTITDDYAGTPQTVVTLTGTGVAPTALSPTPVAFGNQVTGTTSVAKVVTLKNQQTFPITITNVALTGDYAQTNTCGSSLAGSASCTYNVTFTPTVAGSRPGSLVVSVDQGTSPMTVSLTGAGVTPQATALPSAVTFGLQAVSTTSGSQTVTVKNNLAAAMTISGIVPAGDFTVTGTTCGATLAGNGSCAVSVAFAPTVTGARTGTLTITDTANNSPQVVTLSGTATSASSCSAPTTDMKVLVVNNTTWANYVAFPAVTQILDYLGTPYTVFDIAAHPEGMSASFLSDGQCHAYYQGVIFAYGDDIYSLSGIEALNSFESKFHVRQVNWYAEPNGDFGFNPYTSIVDSGAGYNASFSTAGAAVFSYANTQVPLSFTRASIYLATPMAPPSGSVTPLLTDSNGNALSLIYQMGDGREYLTQTFDSNPTLIHNLVVAYGLVRWVTKGVFLGEYHIYSVPQIDDIFMQNDDWQSNTPCPNGGALPQFRLSGTDWDQVVAWQTAKQQTPALANFKMQMAFVGSGATGDPAQGGFVPDTLTPEVKRYKNEFNWISHTWDHQHLDTASAALTDTELLQNNAEALTLGLPGYDPSLLVTPAITGLNNPAFINQAVNDGLRYLVSDTSVLGQPNNGPNPSPNVGFASSINPLLYEVPRHASNLFYNVSTPDGWASEYHCIFAGQNPYDTFTYEQIRDNISSTLLYDMMIGDADPQMFHESNLRAYDGTHSLFSDVYDETLNAYASLLKLPVLSPTQDVIGQNMKSRDLYNQSGVVAQLLGGANPAITLTVPNNSPVSAATVPVTGLARPDAEIYGGQSIAHLPITKGQTITIPLP